MQRLLLTSVVPTTAPPNYSANSGQCFNPAVELLPGNFNLVGVRRSFSSLVQTEIHHSFIPCFQTWLFKSMPISGLKEWGMGVWSGKRRFKRLPNDNFWNQCLFHLKMKRRIPSCMLLSGAFHVRTEKTISNIRAKWLKTHNLWGGT